MFAIEKKLISNSGDLDGGVPVSRVDFKKQ